MSYLYVTDGVLLNFASEAFLHEPGELHCQNGHIIYCGPKSGAPAPPPGARCLRAQGGLVLPSFVNSHGHAAMTLLRGVADDLDLHTWLNHHIFPLEGKLTPEAIYWGSLLACAEMIRSGITCFGDMYYYPHETVRAVRLAGLRAVLGETLLESLMTTQEQKKAGQARLKEFVAAYKGSADIKPILNLHAVYTCSPSLLQLGQELACDLDVGIHMHLCETKEEIEICQNTYGRPPVAHLQALGLLTPRLWVAHGVWLEPEEATLLARQGVGVAHCPSSNMKLASGLANVPGLLKAGVEVGLGTDGCASNNRLDMFSEMDMCAKVHKLSALDPTAMPAELALRMGTCMSAQVIGWPELGRLQVGHPADFIVIDSKRPHLSPMTSPISHLVYAARAADVRHTVCQGQVLMENGVISHLDEQQIMAKAGEHLARIMGS